MQRAHAREGGFTLVEVLVALLIMATMAVMAWRGIDALLKSRDIAQGHLDQTMRLQTVMAQWELDLRALQDSHATAPLSFDGASLRITRQQPLGLQVVVWSVRGGRLLRWEGPVTQTVGALTESVERSQQLLGQESAQLKALEGVAGWQLFFYRGNGWSNAQSSDDVAPAPASPIPPAAPRAAASGALPPAPAPRALLPTGIRMVLQFGEGSGFNGPLTREIVLGPQP
jgi:general secretion pathway protein J